MMADLMKMVSDEFARETKVFAEAGEKFLKSEGGPQTDPVPCGEGDRGVKVGEYDDGYMRWGPSWFWLGRDGCYYAYCPSTGTRDKFREPIDAVKAALEV